MITRRLANRQRGVAVLEFALVFTVVWAVFWSMICYVVPLLVQQAMHRATAEGAQVAAMTNPPSLRVTQAKQTALNSMDWIPAGWKKTLSAELTKAKVDANCPLENGVRTACLLEVSLTMDYAANAPLKPIIGLPGIGTIPALPARLSSTSSVLLQ